MNRERPAYYEDILLLACSLFPQTGTGQFRALDPLFALRHSFGKCILPSETHTTMSEFSAGARVNVECWFVCLQAPKHCCFILRLCSSFISLEMFLAKAESLEGKQNQQHAFQSHEAEEGISATHSSGSGLCLNIKERSLKHKLLLPSHCAPVKLEVSNPTLRYGAKI